jgi:hypothetical protein
MERGSYDNAPDYGSGSAKQLRESPVAEIEKATNALTSAIDELAQRLMPFLRQDEMLASPAPGGRTANETRNVSPVTGSLETTTFNLRTQRARILAICRNFDL